MPTLNELVLDINPSPRKKILFACACIRRVSLNDEQEQIVKLCEEYADGKEEKEKIIFLRRELMSRSGVHDYVSAAIHCIPIISPHTDVYAYAAREILNCFDKGMKGRKLEEKWQVKLFLHMMGKK